MRTRFSLPIAHNPTSGSGIKLGRVRDVHTSQRNDLWLYEAQLAQWQHAAPTPAQSTEIKRLQQQLNQLKGVLTVCLALAGLSWSIKTAM